MEKRGTLIEAHEGFLLVISYNPGYQSAIKDLKQSTRQRFIAIDFDYPPQELEAQIIAHEAGIDDEMAWQLAKLGAKVRNLKDHGLQEGASTRLLIYAGKLISQGIPASGRARPPSFGPSSTTFRCSEALRRLSRPSSHDLHSGKPSNGTPLALLRTLPWPAPDRSASEQSGVPAAVLLPLSMQGDGLSVVLTRRSQHVAHHKGEMCFPGGLRESWDADDGATALREAWEEVGIPPESVEVVGELAPCRRARASPSGPWLGTSRRRLPSVSTLGRSLRSWTFPFRP